MSIVAIRYYNVWFYLHLQSELDVAKFLYLSKRIDAGESFRMADIHRWCAVQKIQYRTWQICGIFILIYARKLKNVYFNELFRCYCF